MGEEKKPQEKETEFKVKDRRYFDQEGNVKSAEVSDHQKPEDQTKDAEIPRHDQSPPPGSLPKPDFGAILFPYIHSALVYLGELQDPATGQLTENLEGARQMVEILDLLQQKTKGNLTQEESRYLENALFDLRMQYLQKAKLVK